MEHLKMESGLKIINKLTSDHVNLTSYSIMRLNLAVQVLGETKGNVLNIFHLEVGAGTGKFCLTMDKLFDCLNVSNTKDDITKWKHFLRPYESIDDVKFAWLDEFLSYFKLWKDSIKERNHANWSENAKSRKFFL